MDVTAADRYPEPDDPILAWLDAALAETEPPHTTEREVDLASVSEQRMITMVPR